MMRNRVRAGLVAAGCLFASNSAADAKVFNAGPVRYVTQTTNVASGGGIFVDAYCPGNSRTIGGGASIAGPVADVSLADTYPLDIFDVNTDPDNGWRAGAFNDTASSKRLQVALACLRGGAGAGQLNYYTANNGVGAGTFSTFASANCAQGRVVGGGAQFPLGDYDGEELSSTHPAAIGGGTAKPVDRWSARVRTDNGPGQFTGYAICAPGSILKRRYRSNLKPIFATQTKRVVAKCPRKPGWRVAGGGVRGITLDVARTMPWDSKDKGKAPDDGWVTKVGLPSQSSDPVVAQAWAICAKKK